MPAWLKEHSACFKPLASTEFLGDADFRGIQNGKSELVMGHSFGRAVRSVHSCNVPLQVKNPNPAAHLHGAAMTQSVVADNSVIALWRTMIGKKVVMTVTGVVLVGFVIFHMVGNLKIFSGLDEIDAYSRFLREMGYPGLGYEQLLWLVSCSSWDN